MKSIRSKREPFGSRKAFVTVYMVFATMVMIPMVGLAIDFSVLYNVKSLLQEACDAGAIGAGNTVQRSTDVTDPTTNTTLKGTILRFFNANFTPVPWRATQLSYNSSITQDATTKVRTIYVTATYNVPMLFMRVLGINNSQVAAQSIAKLRFVNLMVVVDRSGSVGRTGSGTQTNQQIIAGALNQFVADSTTSVFVDGRDVVGLVSFGANYYLDYAPQTNFQTSTPNIGTAINGMKFNTNASTNTGEGLYQAWYQLTQLAQPGALNVIVLVTDGRPSAFTANFSVKAGDACGPSPFQGVITSNVGATNWPPSGRAINGLFQFAGTSSDLDTVVSPTSGCTFPGTPSSVNTDITTIPTIIGPQDHTTGTLKPGTTTFNASPGYYSAGNDATNSVNVRYTAINYAYNVAQAIRQDTSLAPVIYCIGLNFDTSLYPSEEPLEADYLATLANDPNYVTKGTVGSIYAANQSVYRAGQTPGKYYDVSYSGLGAALQDIAGQILRLSAH
jgi:hypothetical protein